MAPSPRIEHKFRPQSEDQVHRNNFIYHSFGANAERRHRNFNTFLVVQDPAIKMQPRQAYPNWKVRPLLNCMNFIFPLIQILGVAFAIDEMTRGFQGMHADKKCIPYKNEGDRFQCNILCQYGFCYQLALETNQFQKNTPR